MPRFYFDVREGERFIPDEDGLEFPSLVAAEQDAAEAAAAIGRDLFLDQQARDVTVELRNEHKQRVCTVTVRMTMERVEPEPTAPG